MNLPAESRFINRFSPFKDWTWDKEVQSQILRSLDTMVTMYSNTHRKKGQPPAKIPPQVQPDYVEKAKKDAKRQKREDQQLDQQDLAAIFEKRNNQIKKLEA